MAEQINLRLPRNLREVAEKHVKANGYRNIQELMMEALREKVYDTSFTKKEIRLIEKLAKKALEGPLYTLDELREDMGVRDTSQQTVSKTVREAER